MKMPKVTPEAEEIFAALVALDSRLEPRKMFGQPAAFVNGNMCLGGFGNDLFLLLNAADLATASKIRGTRPFAPMPGRAMRSYLIMPRTILKDKIKSRRWVTRSVEFTLTLPEKRRESPRRTGADRKRA